MVVDTKVLKLLLSFKVVGEPRPTAVLYASLCFQSNTTLLNISSINRQDIYPAVPIM